jgi:histidinol phosphatase-like enzyme
MNKQVLWVVDRDGTLIEDKDYLGKEDNWKDGQGSILHQ